ncbi:hypothetical protein AMAG_17682 [Allomyces macrogynus ATCC 38327]|uniref:Uncharacterized protein n=1 Tax=Allomyces macrogynus (strain ATCC 38327) TaxID=578462 RepID=A0A0L0RWP1_ALLM3|nr:hypothetical protein AMAG_17682 [Allomyces macrogynus ATCC 38327]|eukprot:KNE54545.1 hypothetical protein AMAG_17682 [Allomyces macrogynus ATCC 38327]
MSAAIRDLAFTDLQVLQGELAALRPQATVYRRAVGNSNLLFLAPRAAVQKEVDDVLNGTSTMSDDRSFTTSTPTLQSPSTSAPPSSATSVRPPQPQTPEANRQGARTSGSSKGGAAKGKGKGKRKAK